MSHRGAVLPERISRLAERPIPRGRYVLYWMQASQRARDNPALQYAAGRADELGLPLLAVFGLTAAYPEANLRHYAFLLEGLEEARRELASAGILLAVLSTEPPEAALALAGPAALVVCDAGYLRHQRSWRERVAAEARCPVEEVEGDAIVPLAAASTKAEWAAATLRPKIHRVLDRYLAAEHGRRVPLPHRDSLGIRVPGNLRSLGPATLDALRIDRSVPPVAGVRGGAAAAEALLRGFVPAKLARYLDLGRDPNEDIHSGLSPYLHLGQISPLRVALAVKGARVSRAAQEAFLEELIVRRELAMNHVRHNPSYDRYEGLPAWARATLSAHAGDHRPHVYGYEELETGRTHDPSWNACMAEMRATGRLHNHLRMYWGKKILEWSASPEEGFATALRLNNRWFLDGRDPNSYAGVAWCFGTHDRPWPERPIFGKVRSMNDAGLRRTFDVDAYIRRVEALARGSAGSAAG